MKASEIFSMRALLSTVIVIVRGTPIAAGLRAGGEMALRVVLDSMTVVCTHPKGVTCKHKLQTSDVV